MRYPDPHVKTLSGAVRFVILVAVLALGWLLAWGFYEAFMAIFNALDLKS